MDVVLNLALPFFGLILLGFLAAKWLAIDASGLQWLNALVWYFALPSLIFQTIAGAPFEQLLNGSFILGTSLATYLVFLLVSALSLLVFASRIVVAGIHAGAASYGNVGYMGLGLAVAAFGPEAAVPAILVFCADNIIQFVLVPLFAVLSRTAQQSTPREVTADIVKSIFLHPFILSAVAGATVAGFSLAIPPPLESFLGFLTNAAAPCALFALGVTLSLRRIEGIGREFPVIVCCKLFVHPLLVLAILSAIGGIDPMWVMVAVLMASLPTATNVFILATQYDAYVEGASSCVLITSLISAFTLTGILLLIDAGQMPTDIGDLMALFR